MFLPPDCWSHIMRDGRTIDDRIREGRIGKIPPEVLKGAALRFSPLPRFNTSAVEHTRFWPFRSVLRGLHMRRSVRISAVKWMRCDRICFEAPFLIPFETWTQCTKTTAGDCWYTVTDLIVVEQDGSRGLTCRAGRLAATSRFWRWLMRHAGLRFSSWLARMVLQQCWGDTP